MEDQELLEKYRETKDQKYISELYGRYMQLVFGSCLKYYKNSADAEDAVMEIYEKLVIKTRSSEIKYFKSWLFTVTRNHCLEKLRKISTRSEKKNDATLMYYEDVMHPDDVTKDKEVDILHECIKGLEEKQRKCVDLFYFKKMAYVDIGKELDLKMGQVRSRIQNGRRNLKICMEENQHRIDQ